MVKEEVHIVSSRVGFHTKGGTGWGRLDLLQISSQTGFCKSINQTHFMQKTYLGSFVEGTQMKMYGYVKKRSCY